MLAQSKDEAVQDLQLPSFQPVWSILISVSVEVLCVPFGCQQLCHSQNHSIIPQLPVCCNEDNWIFDSLLNGLLNNVAAGGTLVILCGVAEQ